MTLAVDCGGTGLKASVLDEAGTLYAKPLRVPTPYPLSAARFLDEIADLASALPAAQRATVGVPGMIRHGVVISTPHYITDSGPRSVRCPTSSTSGPASTRRRRSPPGSASRRSCSTTPRCTEPAS